MVDLDTVGYNKTSEKIVDILRQKTQSDEPEFFRIMVAYFFCKITSMMRCDIRTKDRGDIPVNMYAINLAPSGKGKGYSTNILEEQVINGFRERFLEETFPEVAEVNLARLAVYRAKKKVDCDPDDELERVKVEFTNAGNLAFSFDSATPAAVKQMRHKLLMAAAGSVNMEIDEIGSNLTGNVDVLNTFLELFDVGNIKQKLTKNTQENIRSEEIWGRTPTNLLLFGTPSKLLNGGRVEEEFITMNETGYGRRCIFGYCESAGIKSECELTDEEIYDIMVDNNAHTYLLSLSDRLRNLADPIKFNTKIDVSKEITLLMIKYKRWCEAQANEMPDHEEIRKAELSHRYFKALKLAGAYAFIEECPEITEECWYNAVKLVEDSGRAFNKILTRDRNYVKLAKYLATIGREVTYVDLVEDLPFYKGSLGQKQEMMNYAIAYGAKNNIIIKKSMCDNVDYLIGESLEETDLNKIKVSFSTKMAHEYELNEIPYDQIHKLTQAANHHWCNHGFINEHRCGDNVVAGFNLLVLDIDEGISLDTAKLLMKKYKFCTYTTKRHTDTANRFRMILPMTHVLKLDEKEYKEFMDNVYDWLPFGVDRQTGQRCKKWMSHVGTHEYNEGELFDPLMFIPKTAKSEDYRRVIDSQQSLSNVERWFINNSSTNRNVQLHKYAMLLIDSGMDLATVENNVKGLNNKLPKPMNEVEIDTTIMKTVTKELLSRSKK